MTNHTTPINFGTIGGFNGVKPIAQTNAKKKAMGYDGPELAFDAGCFASGISEAECKNIAQSCDALAT